jgi:glycosyltransferase involved in cell wall biosynthesis
MGSLRVRLVRGARSVVVPLVNAWLDRAVAGAARRAQPRTRTVAAAPDRAPAPIRFLLMNAWGVGGTIRTTFTTASYLGASRDVEVVSLLRHRHAPGIPMPAGLRIRSLFDGTDRVPRPRNLARLLLFRTPSRLWSRHDAAYRHASLWTDVLLVRWLRSLPSGTVVIATRPALILIASRLAPAGVVVIAQEHQRLAHHPTALRSALGEGLVNASLVVTLTRTDQADYERFLGPTGPPVMAIPNAVPDAALGPGDPGAHRLLAAGRLVRQKGFDLLLRAFAEVAPQHPEWELDIFGRGALRAELERQVDELGLAGRARINQPTDRLGERMRDASAYVLSSRYEGFPLVLLEAMSAGLAVVAFDCPTGPDEIVTNGKSGLLVPAGDVSALAAALRRVMGDEQLRRRLAGTAPGAVARYAKRAVGRQWDVVLDGEPDPISALAASISLRRRVSRSRRASCGFPRACAARSRRRCAARPVRGRGSSASCRPLGPCRARPSAGPSAR